MTHDRDQEGDRRFPGNPRVSEKNIKNPQTAAQPGGADDTGPDQAVALDYDPREGSAPRVVAKGQGSLAEKIIEVARANGVAVRKDADLAALLSAVDLDQEIPIEAFAAVAEILSYVYRANGNTLPRNQERSRTEKDPT